MRRRAAVLVVLVLVACNAISGLGEDFTLTSPNGPANDGGADSTTTADVEPGTDGATQDANADAGNGDAPSDAPVGPFSCDAGDAANVVFCTDFETDAGWTTDELTRGVVTFELDAGPGGTRAMHARVDDAGVSRRAALWKRLGSNDAKNYAHYDVAFDFKVTGKTFNYGVLGLFGVTQPSGGGALRFFGVASYMDQGLDVAAEVPDVIAQGGAQVADTFGAWHHAFITLDREPAGTYAMTLTIDATLVDQRSGFDFGNPQTAEVRIGIMFTSQTKGTMDVFYDNVLVHRY